MAGRQSLSCAKDRVDSVEAGDCLPGFCRAETVVMGCGNRLLGDDGFGPEVIACLRDHCRIPDGVVLLDAGTGISRLLFDIALAPRKPRRLIVVDAMRLGLAPGTVSVVSLDKLENQVRSFSAHQEPTSQLLKELRELVGIEVVMLVAEPEFMPEEVSPGLSPALREAVPKACEIIVDRFIRHRVIYSDRGNEGKQAKSGFRKTTGNGRGDGSCLASR